MSSEPVAPFDPSKPNIARAYDFILGGKDNFAADREVASKILEAYPLTGVLVRESRSFLIRAVDYVSRQGVTQFIDVGSGLPTSPNTHEVAYEADPDACVVYVDNDPVVIAHARALLAADGCVAVAPGDVHDPEAILASVRKTGVVDLDKPVCVILAMLLHFLDPAEAANRTAAFVHAIAPGSYMIMSVGVNNNDPELGARFAAAYTAAPLYLHKHDDVAGYFAGLEIVEPGLTEARFWRSPSPPPAESRPADIVAGVGRKPLLPSVS
ncbi:MAG: SAM-dependent methyltransferase [Streptosporangiaceae bacterium]|nr:SAM-dependent methyltransferase [Streptosporangiaceae bacterium]MBV9854966.1 SAM-dependent methyltransferase [Streptosporangiaceae bacterium]